MLYREIYVVKDRQTIDDVSVAIGFSAAYIPSSEVVYAMIQAIGGDVRYCIDGTIPAADKGFRLTEDSTIEIWGGTALDKFLVVDDGGTAELEVVYHGQGV